MSTPRPEVSLKPLRTPHLWVVAPLGLAAALGAYRLDAKSLWFDEGFSVWLARLDWSAAWQLMRGQEANMMLYYALLHLWLRLGLSEVAVRSLSTVAAVACIVPFYFLGVRVLGARYALLASFLLASNAFFIHYAQEARGYSLVLLLTIASSLLFLRAIDRPTAGRFAAYAIVSVLAVYAHFFAAWVLAAQFLAAMLFPDRPGLRGQFIGVQAAVAAGVAPLAIAASRRYGALAWVPRPTIGTLVSFGNELTGYAGSGLTMLYLLLCAACLLGGRRAPGSADERRLRWQRQFLLAWLALPISGTLAISWLFSPIFSARFLFVSLAPLSLVAAGGVRVIRPNWVKLSAMIAVFAFAFGGLRTWYTKIKKDDWRSAAAYVVSRAAPGDGIAFVPLGGRWPVEYYLEQLRPGGIPLVSVFPAAAWGAFAPDDRDLTGRSGDSWKDRLAPLRRVWVVEWMTRRRQEALRAVAPDRSTGYCIEQVQSFYRVRASLYVAPPCQAPP